MADVKRILQVLTEAGHEAYIVGGPVRDTLLGRPVHDWDITTSALPEQVRALFPKTVPTGIAHGTVTVLEGGESFEVTTFRTDGDYLDGRHPKSVQFVRSLREDLSRRDFTVNAMAMDAEGNIYDYFGGREDLQAKCLRCVGAPEKRFEEDALRMLRAVRFAAQLDFAIEKKTRDAISAKCAGVRLLSCERVRDEVEKTLLSPKPQMVSDMIRLHLLSPFGLSGRVDLRHLKKLPPERLYRWAGLFYACPQIKWEQFRLDKKTGAAAEKSARLAAYSRTETGWKALVAAEGAEVALCTAYLRGEREQVAKILQSGEPLTLKDLAVTGADFPDLSGEELGAKLQALLLYVHRHPEENKREVLLQK